VRIEQNDINSHLAHSKDCFRSSLRCHHMLKPDLLEDILNKFTSFIAAMYYKNLYPV
jgi:hypothetical protein